MRSYYQMSGEEVLQEVNGSLEPLTNEQVREHQEQYGPNELVEGKKKTILQIFLEQYKDFLVIILIIAAVASGFMGDVESAAVILIVITMNAILGTVQTIKAEQSLASLKKLSGPEAKVLRDGAVVQIPSAEVTVGDIVMLEAGDYIPADGRLLECASMKVDESALTGESLGVEKTTTIIKEENVPLGDRVNMVYSGSFVTYGRGSFLVTEIGMETEVGKIAGLLKNTSEKRTPLQVNLDQFGQKLSILILVFCGILFGISILREYWGQGIGAALTGGSIAVAAGITAEPTWQPIFVDGQQVEMQAYNIAGHNYVKLRDMGKQVGFNVYWSAGVQIDTGHPYTGIAPAASGIRVSSYKGSTLRPGDRSGLNISPSADIKSVVSTQPNVIRVENASGFWTAIAVSSGTSDVVVTDQHGKTAALTLTVADGKQSASVPESGASQTDAARQEIVRLVNQVRRENGAPELTVNAALMDAAQHCASLRVAYHQNKVECEAVAASGYPHGFGSNITAFTNVPASEIAGRAVENWRNSPGHFQTMINPDCDTIGVGISTDEGGTICFLFVGDPNAHTPYA